MRVSAINGYYENPENLPVGNVFRRAGRWASQNLQPKQIIQTGRQIVQTVTKPIIKVAAVAPRLAFLGLIRMNVRGMATNLNKALGREDLRNRLFNVWSKFGGAPSELSRVIQLGAKEKRIFGPFEIEVNGINAEPATTTAAAITAAQPIIMAVVPILAIVARELLKEKEPTPNLPNEILQQASAAGTAQNYNVPVDFPAETSAAGKNALETAQMESSARIAPTGAGFQISPALIIGGVVLVGGALYMSQRKKRR